VAKEIFDRHMKGPHQIQDAPRTDVKVSAEELLAVPSGEITEEGVRANVRVGIQYLEAWLGGSGCVPLYNLMEDAATAEISRSQLWQWVRHEARLADGRPVTRSLVTSLIAEEAGRLPADRLPRLALATKLFEEMTLAEEFPEFLTLAAYQHLD
jgi:malate synthase